MIYHIVLLILGIVFIGACIGVIASIVKAILRLFGGKK